MKSDVLFDQMGAELPTDLFALARKLGYSPVSGVIDHAVRDLGFVRIRSLRDCLLIELEPATVGHLAVWSAFYEIIGRAPRRVMLAHPDRGNGARRYELFPSAREAVRRVEEFVLHAGGGRAVQDRPFGPSSRRVGTGRKPPPSSAGPSMPGKILSFRGKDGLAVRTWGTDCAQRMHRPVEAISALDGWMGHALGIWRNARQSSNLPSVESLGGQDISGIAGGKAHLLDASAGEPEGYWFRHWGRSNSYVGGGDSLSLRQMPSGLMREAAIEDYGRAVTTGSPCYSLISLVEEFTGYSYARLILPLAANGRAADRLLVLINERDLTPELC